MGYFAQDFPVAGYGGGYGGYGEMPEMVGYGNPYAGAGFAGYMRQARPAWNPGCPVPTNVAGFSGWAGGRGGRGGGLAGYVRPSSLSPACGLVRPGPAGSIAVPDTFRPLW